MTKDTIESVNQRISNMVAYGTKHVIIQSNCYELIWSNSQKKWNVSYYAYHKNDKITLDANELLVKESKKVIQKWIDDKLLNDLPLYKNSFEYMIGKHKPMPEKPKFKLGSIEERDYYLSKLRK